MSDAMDRNENHNQLAGLGKKIISEISRNGNRQVTETVLLWLIGYLQYQKLAEVNGESAKEEGSREATIQLMESFFGNYTTLIIDAFSCEKASNSEIGNAEWQQRCKEQDTDIPLCEEIISATKRLCWIKTPVSNNILHLVLKKPAIEWSVAKPFTSPSPYNRDRLSIKFEPQNRMAREELKRRGEPVYNPEFYYEENAWKFP